MIPLRASATLFLATALGATTPLAGDVPKGFTPIFYGKDLAGWHVKELPR